MTLHHSSILETPARGPHDRWPCRQWQWRDESDCARWAEALARQPGIDDALITLEGPLGAGKTTLVRHLLRALGIVGRIKSPTYALMEPYELPGGVQAAHFDFYRFADPHEWAEAGLRDVFAQPGLKLVEWPDKAQGLLPPPDLHIEIEPLDDHARALRVSAGSERGRRLMEGLPA